MTMNTSYGNFFAVVGPSGAGKDSLIDGARSLPNTQYVFAKRVVTRVPGASWRSLRQLFASHVFKPRASGRIFDHLASAWSALRPQTTPNHRARKGQTHRRQIVRANP